MHESKSKKSNASLNDVEITLRREKLEDAILRYGSNLLMDIRMYLKRFGLEHFLGQAEDIWSEIKVTALQNAGNYNPECSAKAWLRQAAFYTVLHLNRDEKKEITTFSISDVVQQLGFEDDVDQTNETELFDFLRQKSLNHLWGTNSFTFDDILSVVEKDDRKILELKFVEGLTAKEIAAHYGISEGAAEVRLHRAKNRLKREFLK